MRFKTKSTKNISANKIQSSQISCVKSFIAFGVVSFIHFLLLQTHINPEKIQVSEHLGFLIAAGAYRTCPHKV